MDTLAGLGSFAVVVGLLTVTPGMDTALIVRTAAIGARRRAWGVVAGIQGGTMIWGLLTSAGVTALLTASHVAYEVLRWAGACYLVWIGIGMIRATVRRKGQPVHEPAVTEPDDRVGAFRSGLRRGLLTNLLNPKMGAFYVALLPQFIPAGASPLLVGSLLAGVHVVLGTLWSAFLIMLAHRFRAALQRPRARRVLDRATGAVIAAFGVHLVTGPRL